MAGKIGKALVVRAGPTAIRRLREDGFHADLFDTLVGASGGAKWLVLRHLDEVLVDRVVAGRRRPLDTLGSSIGSFRHACFAQSDPHSALARFAEAYVEQAYAGPDFPSMEEISAESDRILGHFLGPEGAAEIASNPRVRTHVVAARLRVDRGRDRGLGFQTQLGLAAMRNAVSRNWLGHSFERILFRPPEPSIEFRDFRTAEYVLEARHVRHALLASGSIPLLMAGVTSAPDVPGMLFDGGIVDYHFDFAFRRRNGLVLFPHFFDRITPGWFDKPLKWRRPDPRHLDDVVMVAPSDEFVAQLPGGKVPDRQDFLDFETDERIERWSGIVEQCRRLADDFTDLLDGNRLVESIEPFPA